MSTQLAAAGAGFLIGTQFILAIGAQNAFVLRQGLRREHVFAICLTCALSDALLIALGVSSFEVMAERFPGVAPAFVIAGSAFLIWYGIKHFRDALRGGATLSPAEGTAGGLRAALITCLALTWLNPHVYLDTVILLGALSTRFPGAEAAFGIGAACASALFFFALGYGARLLTPVFARPRSWQILDLVIALTMWGLAAKLLLGGAQVATGL
ncbi:LysE/ArgO family amino acid transporter [Dinoroseobacter sp. S124A]|uniref:LysE/ArgO family amino acid transporter n=1 Tax=Dinoroseobacter sp. S124A TaxID=3415128 RepID=UPI003C7E0EC8